MPHRIIDRKHLTRAKSLRRATTDAEARLWGELRGNRLCGHNFRRQVPLGPFIVDFLCYRRRLIVELDGEQHGFDANRRADLRRTAWLESQGFTVVRFWNDEALKETDAVCSAILDALGGPLDMEPPPEAGRLDVARLRPPRRGEVGR